MSADEIIFAEIKGEGGNIGKIILNRPQALNALNLSMCQAIDKKLQQWAVDSTIKAVTIQGNGERAFCAGGDVRYCYDMGPSRVEKSLEFFWHEYRMNHRIFHFPKPYIALLHGITMGGGAGVSIHGSHRVAAENLNFAMPEAGIGFHTDVGTSYVLSRCLDKTGFYLGLTGERIGSADAHYMGLIDAIVPHHRFDDLLATLAGTKFTDDVNVSVTRVINEFIVPVPPPELLSHRRYLDRSFSAASVENILSELRQENNLWTNKTADTIATKSPTSLKVIFRELCQAANNDFDTCLRTEYRLTRQFLLNHDFYEGVRAAIVDKDRSPQWQPATLAEVNEKVIDQYFAPSSAENLRWDK